MVCVEQTCHQGSMCRCEVHPGAYRTHKDHKQHNKWHSTGRMQRSAQHKLWAIRSGYQPVQHILSSIWRDRKNKEGKKKRYQQIGNERKLWVQEKVKTVGSRPWQYHLNRATELSRMCKWKKKLNKENITLLLYWVQQKCNFRIQLLLYMNEKRKPRIVRDLFL